MGSDHPRCCGCFDCVLCVCVTGWMDADRGVCDRRDPPAHSNIGVLLSISDDEDQHKERINIFCMVRESAAFFVLVIFLF